MIEKLSKKQEKKEAEETVTIKEEAVETKADAKETAEIIEEAADTVKPTYEVEQNGVWIDGTMGTFGVPITGVRFGDKEVLVKTTNGWFEKTDPEKAPVIMVECTDENYAICAHVNGGEWLPITPERAGCNVPLDVVTFVEIV